MFSLRTANSNEFRETGSIEFEHQMIPFSFTSWLKNENVGTLEFLPEFSVSPGSLWLQDSMILQTVLKTTTETQRRGDVFAENREQQ